MARTQSPPVTPLRNTVSLSPEGLYQDRMSPSSPIEYGQSPWDCIEETPGKLDVSPTEAAEADGPCLSPLLESSPTSSPELLAPLLSEEQCLPGLHGNFKASRPWKEQISPGWVRVKTILDSGAAKSIAPPTMAIGVRIDESEMSSKGQSFITAGEGRIANQGQQVLQNYDQ